MTYFSNEGGIPLGSGDMSLFNTRKQRKTNYGLYDNTRNMKRALFGCSLTSNSSSSRIFVDRVFSYIFLFFATVDPSADRNALMGPAFCGFP